MYKLYSAKTDQEQWKSSHIRHEMDEMSYLLFTSAMRLTRPFILEKTSAPHLEYY